MLLRHFFRYFECREFNSGIGSKDDDALICEIIRKFQYFAHSIKSCYSRLAANTNSLHMSSSVVCIKVDNIPKQV